MNETEVFKTPICGKRERSTRPQGAGIDAVVFGGDGVRSQVVILKENHCASQYYQFTRGELRACHFHYSPATASGAAAVTAAVSTAGNHFDWASDSHDLKDR